MSVFDLIRILHAMHFLLGIPIAVLYLRFLIFNPILTVATQSDLSWSDAIRSALFGGLIWLWYFVWYGSIVFSLSRRFPIFSIRLSSVLLLIVYVGWIVFLSVQSDNPWDRAMENPLYPLAMVVMLLLGLTGVTVLPWLKTVSNAEEEALLKSKDRKIDQQHPWHQSE
jgi:hypothetical protein